ncbi:MAG: sigma-70 family RNA polymerase sigma factor [Ruminococcus sp.]|nr:sigma-70 family RNA polymerase sigma factor [Ruminococcus sp.]
MDKAAELYQRFLSGNRDALAEIILMHRDGVTLYINSIVKNITVAEDLMEDTFVRLCVKKPEFSGKSSFRTWLFSIARHIAMDYLRRQRFFSVPPEDIPDLASEENIEHSYVRKEAAVHLHAAMNELKPEYRQALYLMYFEDMSGADIAHVMGLSQRQVRNILYNARKSLKNILERKGFTYEGL